MSSPGEPGSRTVHVIVTGHVQGVGFRYYSQNEARLLGLRGWVKNLPNGNVELELQGAPHAVAAMLDWLRSGPAHADVESVHVTESSHGSYGGFSIVR